MDDFQDYTPCMLTMLFSSRSDCEKSCPDGKTFPTGQHRESITAPPPPPTPFFRHPPSHTGLTDVSLHCFLGGSLGSLSGMLF